jgi:NADH:ubiquinone oxidoreductase subunit E
MENGQVRIIPPAEAHAIIARYSNVDPMEAMIPILQEIQTQFGFVSEPVVNQMAEELGISVTEIYGVVTFYSFFRFSPVGGRILMTCEGTSCYVRGAGKLRELLDDRLHLTADATTGDGRISFVPQSVCLGACDLGPLVEFDGQYYSHVDTAKMNSLLDEWLAAPTGETVHGHGPAAADLGPYGFGPTAEELGSALPFETAPGERRSGNPTRGTRG